MFQQLWLVVRHDDGVIEDDHTLRSKGTTYCSNDNEHWRFNAALWCPPKSWEYIHTVDSGYPKFTSLLKRLLFCERRRWDLRVLLWWRRYWPWWWTGRPCNLNVIHWKASPTQPVAFIWMCLPKIQLLFLSFYSFHPLILHPPSHALVAYRLWL